MPSLRQLGLTLPLTRRLSRLLRGEEDAARRPNSEGNPLVLHDENVVRLLCGWHGGTKRPTSSGKALAS